MEDQITYKTLLTDSNYRRLFFAAVISRFGDAIDMIAYSFMVFELTGSAVLMATLFAVNGIPSLVFNLISGVLVSYWPKKRVVVLCDLGRGLVVTLTALLYWFGLLQVWHLYLFTVLSSTFEAFRGPASSVLLMQVVSRERMDHAVSLDSSGRSAAELVGYSAAALLISAVGVSGTILVDGGTFFISALLIALMHLDREILTKEKLTPDRYFSDLRAGIVYAAGHPLVRTILLFAGGMGFFLAPFNALQMPFVLEVMELGEVGISVLSVTFMSAMIGGSLLVPAISKRIGYKNLFVTGGTIIGIGYMLLGYAPILGQRISPYTALVLAAMVMGSTVTFMNVPIRVALMKRVDETMIPRMIALIGVFQLASVPIGGGISGALVAYVSMPVIFMVSGAVVCLIFIAQHFNRDLKGLNEDNVL